MATSTVFSCFLCAFCPFSLFCGYSFFRAMPFFMHKQNQQQEEKIGMQNTFSIYVRLRRHHICLLYIRMIKCVRVCINISVLYDKKRQAIPTFYLNKLNTSDLIFIFLFYIRFIYVFFCHYV